MLVFATRLPKISALHLSVRQSARSIGLRTLTGSGVKYKPVTSLRLVGRTSSEQWPHTAQRIMEKVLIVDNDRASRDLVRAILKSVRCEIIEASHGQQGLDMLRQEQPDLVLLDLDMPGLDGLEVVKKIREDPTLVNLPVVAVTAFAMDRDREKAMEAGFTAYITKPVRAAALRQQVRQLLGAATGE